MASIYLGVDIGTTSTKCMAVDECGHVLSFAQRAYSLSFPQQGWVEQDPEDYWCALVDVVRQCIRSEKVDAGDIASLSLSTQGDTLILASHDGKPLMPAISWMDARAESEFHELISETGSSFWYRETGKPLTPLSSACKIRWMERHRPDVWRQARLCWVSDFLANRLCGRFVADVPSASWTPLFSPSKRGWSAAVAGVLRVSEDHLPDALESGEVIGEITRDASAELGLPPTILLVAGAFDQSAAAHGAGALPAGRSILSCGTAWVLYLVADDFVLDPRECICICCHVHQNEWGLVLPFTGGSAYDWLQRTLADTSDEISTEHESLIFIPHLYGGLSPDWRKESKGSLLGLTISHTPADIRFALMRGIAYEARRNLEAAERLVGQVASIRMVGGAGKSDIWPQIVADVINRPVEVAELVESACLGAARLAAGHEAGDWSGRDAVKVYTPRHDRVVEEEGLYRKYLAFYETLAEAYES